MQVVVSHTTALRWLLRNANPRNAAPRAHRAPLLPCRAPHQADARQLLRALCLPDDVAHVLVGAQSGRRAAHGLEIHLHSGPLPAGSIIRIEPIGYDGPAFVASPELVFLQMATTRPIEEAVYFGFALCSSYRIDEWAPHGIMLRDENDGPLTSPDKIAAFLEKVEGARGNARARRALQYVRANSFSPMESALAISLGMPLRMGGFNFRDIELNPEIKMRDGIDAYGNARFITRKPDLLIGKKSRTGTTRQVALDYDSFAFHSERERLLRDAMRRNELSGRPGMTHLSVTTAQVNDFTQFVRLTEQVRRALGKRREPIRKAHVAQSDFEELQSDIRHRQFELWKKIVRMSPFRQEE